MSDPSVPPGSATSNSTANDNEPFHRLSARIATLDLDPSTLEILIAVLNVGLDQRDQLAPATT